MFARGGEDRGPRDGLSHLIEDLGRACPPIDWFRLASSLEPSGDQPEAIKKILELFQATPPIGCVTLNGATGTGKTFVLANVVKELKKPTLILCHTKVLAEQLHAALEELFPEANVELYLSALDQYTPATIKDGVYCPASKGRVDKNAVERRERAASAVQSKERHTIVVASTAAIFPSRSSLHEEEGSKRFALTEKEREELAEAIERELEADVRAADSKLYEQVGTLVNEVSPHLSPGLRVVAESLLRDLAVAAESDKLELLGAILALARPAQVPVSMREAVEERLHGITPLVQLRAMVEEDVKNIRKFGTCGELFDKYGALLPEDARGTLLDKFAKGWREDWLLVLDESHASLKAFSTASKSNRSRVKKLVDGGYRLSIAREKGGPLSREEMWALKPQNVLFISATPGEDELELCPDAVVKMVQRPTHVLDPVVEVRDQDKDMEGIMGEVRHVCGQAGQVILATRTQKEAEAMAAWLQLQGVRADCVHCNLDNSIRANVIKKFRRGGLQVLIGIGLIMEGLDFPAVELVVILDAEKANMERGDHEEGGLYRNQRCFEQLAGRAARNVKGRVFLCTTGGKRTKAMEETLRVVAARRKLQEEYNQEHGHEPMTLVSPELRKALCAERPSPPASARKDGYEAEWDDKPHWSETLDGLGDRLIDWVVLVGGKAPGVRGDIFPGCGEIGPKFAWDLILKCGSLEKVFEAAETAAESDLGRRRQLSLKHFAEKAAKNKDLVQCWMKLGFLPTPKSLLESAETRSLSFHQLARAFIPGAEQRCAEVPEKSPQATSLPGSDRASVAAPAVSTSARR